MESKKQRITKLDYTNFFKKFITMETKNKTKRQDTRKSNSPPSKKRGKKELLLINKKYTQPKSIKDFKINYIKACMAKSDINSCQGSSSREFPGGPVVRTQRFHCLGQSSIPG